MKLIRILALCTTLSATRAGAYTNRVLRLDGVNDYVQISSTADLMPTDEITLEAWINPQASPGAPAARWMTKSDGQTASSSRSYEWYQAGDTLEAYVFLGTDTYAALTVQTPSFQWTHVAITYDRAASEIMAFTNGVLAASSTDDAGGFPINNKAIRASTAPLRIGNILTGGFATGLIDDVRIWSQARTAGEIHRDLTRKLTGQEAALVAWWDFNAADGLDATGNGHAGTLFGGPSFLADTSLPTVAVDIAIEVSFPARFPSTLYQLQRCENLEVPAWADVGEKFGGTHGEAAALQSIQGDDLGYVRATMSTNQVLRLDGSNEYAEVNSSSDLQPPDEITVEAWIYPENNPLNNAPRWYYKGVAGDAYSERSYELSQVGDLAIVSLFVGTTVETKTYTEVWADAPRSTWTHVAFTYTRSDGLLTLFTNGVQAMSTAMAGGQPMAGKPLRPSSVPLRFGQAAHYPGTYAKGLIDDVRIWREAKTAGEIRRDMSRRLTGKEAALVAWWHFDAADGADATGLGHTGTFFGGPAFLADTTAPVIGIETAMEVAFPTMFPSTTYRLQGTGSLLTPNWMDIGDGFAGTPGETRVLQSTRGLTYRYFRVVQQ